MFLSFTSFVNQPYHIQYHIKIMINFSSLLLTFTVMYFYACIDCISFNDNRHLSIISSAPGLTDNSEQSAQQQANNSENCICVWHYLCDKNYNIKTAGEDIIDERIGPNDPPKTPCPPGQLCCIPPPSAQVSTTLPPATTQPPTTKTVAPTTIPPTTVPPTTLPPTTPTTPRPTPPPTTSTPPPTTAPPTTAPPTTTQQPTTIPPTTAPLTTVMNGTSARTTAALVTTAASSTAVPPIISPTTLLPSTTQAPVTFPPSNQTIVSPSTSPRINETKLNIPSTNAPAMTIPTAPPGGITIGSTPGVTLTTAVPVATTQSMTTLRPPQTIPTGPPVTIPTIMPPQTIPTLPPVTRPTLPPPVTVPTLPTVPPTLPMTSTTTTMRPTLPQSTTSSVPGITSVPPVIFPTTASPTTSPAPTVPPVIFPTTPQIIFPTNPTTSLATTLPPATTLSPVTTLPPATTVRPPTPGPPGSQCGVQYVQTTTQENLDPVVARFAEFPWMLAVLDSTALSPDGTIIRNAYLCGASLIRNNIALTAAHCIKNQTAKNLVVRAGELNTLFANEPLPHQDRTVSQIIKIHQDFNRSTLFNDIALLRMEEPVVFANNVVPICLPSMDQKFVGSTCIATGWGKNAFGPPGKYQSIMHKVSLTVISNADCQTKLQKNTRLSQYFRLHSSFMCAGGIENQDTCTGDGGGPLVCRTSAGTWVQAGIVSWGIGCGQADVPGVYVDVPTFASWINSTILEMMRDTLPRFAAA